MKKIELQKIQNGVVLDLFDNELRKVIENIEDDNTVANQERSITLKIAIKPDKTRRTGEVKIQAFSTLAKVKPAESILFFDRDEAGKFAVYEDDPGPELPGINEQGTAKITSFPKASNGG
jgi:hypothetical protein